MKYYSALLQMTKWSFLICTAILSVFGTISCTKDDKGGTAPTIQPFEVLANIDRYYRDGQYLGEVFVVPSKNGSFVHDAVVTVNGDTIPKDDDGSCCVYFWGNDGLGFDTVFPPNGSITVRVTSSYGERELRARK